MQKNSPDIPVVQGISGGDKASELSAQLQTFVNVESKSTYLSLLYEAYTKINRRLIRASRRLKRDYKAS
jgi:hypothetical protein